MKHKNKQQKVSMELCLSSLEDGKSAKTMVKRLPCVAATQTKVYGSGHGRVKGGHAIIDPWYIQEWGTKICDKFQTKRR